MGTHRHLCAWKGCREMTHRLLCWPHWRAVPARMHRQSDETIKAWARAGGQALPALRESPAVSFNETAEKDPA